MTIADLETQLHHVLSARDRRSVLVTMFIKAVCDSRESGEEWEILRDLAWDLAYYEADPVARTEDPSYYGDERLEMEIAEALHKIEDVRRAGHRST